MSRQVISFENGSYLRRVAVAVFSLLLMAINATAHAAQPCDESVARYRLGQLNDALQKPESMAALDAAKADFAADGDFDNERDARVLAAAAVYFKVERHLDAGEVEEACQFLEQADQLISEVVAGQ